FTPFFWRVWFQYIPNRDLFWDSPATVRQWRSLNNIGARADLSYSRGRHEIKGGLQLSHWLLTENFYLGLTDPTFNPVCLNADGSPDTNPTPSDPNACAGLGLTPNPGLAPGLVAYDLTRSGSLFTFGAHADIKALSAYLEDSIKLANWPIKAGVGGDHYNGWTRPRKIEPGLASASPVSGT